jgi:aspartate/methionine/tyrosine aminotransferase
VKIEDFKLERYFARYEFSAKFLLSPSDCESISMHELLELADLTTRQMWDKLRLGYTESAGDPALRAEICRTYESIEIEDVLEAVPEEAIFLAMNAMLRAGDRVVSVWPVYQSLYSIARSLGCAVDVWPVECKAGRWNVDLERLEDLLTGARMLVLNFPHNPTGFLPDQKTFEEILSIADRKRVFVFSDEMYRLLEHREEDRLPAVCDRLERAVSLSGLSKAYGLPGLRVGWLASQDIGFIQRCQSLKDYTTICASAPAEILGLVALRSRKVIVGRCLGIVQRNLALARDFFRSQPALFDWIDPQGGSTVFPLWKGAETVDNFCAEALEKRGVMIVPGTMFDASGNHFRIGLGRSNFPSALDALKEYIQFDRR